MAIEFKYEVSNPFYVDNLSDAVWNVALAGGLANIRTDNIILVNADVLSKPLHGCTFIRIINRERKILVAADLGFTAHSNPTNIAEDGLGITNQLGASWQTYNKPPTALVPIIPCIEQWKKVAIVGYGVIDRQFSPVAHPSASRFDMRQMRLNHSIFRAANSFNPSTYALKYGETLYSYQEVTGLRKCVMLMGGQPMYNGQTHGLDGRYDMFNFLVMPPDMDYPETSQLFPNNDFADTYVVFLGGVQKLWPTGIEIAGPLNAGERTVSNTPYVENATFWYNGSLTEEIIKVTANNKTEIMPVIDDPMRSIFNLTGFYKRFAGTAPALRVNNSRYRFRRSLQEPDYDDMPSWAGVTVTTNNSGVSSATFTGYNTDYFSDIEYSSKSDNTNYAYWETDNGTSQTSWQMFGADGTIAYNVSALIRHHLKPGVGNVASAKYKFRYNQGAVDTNVSYFKWLGWADGSDYLVDYDSNTENITPVVYERTQIASMRGSQVMFAQFGQKGSRGPAYKMKFIKSSVSHSVDVIVGDAINRLIYKGDVLKYEVLVDAISVDRKVYLDVEYYNAGQSGATSLMSSSISVWDATWTQKDNKWYKVSVEFPAAMYGKYIKYIHFRSSDSNSVKGDCLYYINEVQIINLIDMFNGRQFLSALNFRRRGWAETDLAHDPGMELFSYPFISVIAIIDDGAGNTSEFYYSPLYIDSNPDNNASNEYHPFDWTSNGLGYDDKTKWITGLHAIPFNNFIKEIIVFVGCFKTFEISAGKYVGPRAGGTLEAERFFFYPMSDLSFVSTYSTDDWDGGDIDNDAFDSFIDYQDALGWKAWALQLRSKYFSVE